MPKFDIIVVTYNSGKWFPNFFKTLRESNYALNQISLIFVDNNSSDNTISLLENYKSELKDVLFNFQIIATNKNNGFGIANNLGAKHATSDLLFFLNADTEFYSDTLSNLEIEIQKDIDTDFKTWELRQAPYEHPKFYDPISFETSWSSGAAVVIDKAVFNKIKGFDDNIFMYCEDVDISWRIQRAGYKIKYLPKVSIIHHSYEEGQVVKPNQYFNSIVNHLYLRVKHGGFKEIRDGIILIAKVLKHGTPFPKGKQDLVNRIIKNIPTYLRAFIWGLFRKKPNLKRNLKTFSGIQFREWDYTIRRDGDFLVAAPLDSEPLVSVIVRSYNRSPEIIREALTSIQNQTYKNIEIQFIEDGTTNAQKLIEKEFENLNISYTGLEKNVGRSAVGNIGMEKSQGEFLIFLDDDDLFYPDHIEVLVRELIKDSSISATYSKAFETPISFNQNTPYDYQTHDYKKVYGAEFNRLKLLHSNYIPIQTILFKKDLFLNNGGFDTTIDFLEDWDLWLRYSFDNKFKFIDKVTSLYRVPFSLEIANQRHEDLKSTLEYINEKHSKQTLCFNYKEIKENITHLIQDIECNGAVRDYEIELIKMKKTISWRITHPLRLLSKIFLRK